MTGGNADSDQGVSNDETGGWNRPSRRTVLGGLGGVAAGSLAVGQVSGQFGSSGPATPTVEGPVEGGSQTGRPLTAAPHDFESAGYVEEEYFISGDAEPIDAGGLFGGVGGGSGSSTDGPAEYKTRILVYRPEDPADFNGGVLVEWFNVSLQTDFPVAWPNAYDFLQRNGWAVALVSAQKVGVDDSAEDMDLVTWDPERYGDLHHPGDTYALDIFAQAIQALRRDGGSATSGTSGGLWGSGGSSGGSSGGLWGSGGSDDGGSSGGLWGSGGSSSGTSSGSSGGLFGAGLTLGQIGSGSSGGLWGSGGSSGGSSGESSGGSSGGLWGSGGSSGGSSGGLWGSGGSGGSAGGTGGTGDDPHPLGGMDAEFVVATGQSQSSGYINGFINEVEPDYDVVDGFLPAAGMPLNLSKDVKPTIWLNTMSEAAGGSLSNPGQGEGSGDGLFSNVSSGNISLEDVDIDPVVLAELTDTSPPEDEALFRFWEVAGAVHVNQWLSFWAGATRRRDFGTDDPAWDPQKAANYGEQEDGQYDVCEYNYFPHRYTFPAALDALQDWIQIGIPAPSAPRMERAEEGGVAKDEHGNAVGGIRLPPIEAPVATYEDSCDLPTGKTIRFDEATLDSLYSTHDEYVSQFEAAAQQAVQDGFLLQEGADELVARAEASPIGR